MSKGYHFTVEDDPGNYLLLPDAIVEIPVSELRPGMKVLCYDDVFRRVETVRELP